jgi:hypothetical protein
MAQRGQRGPNPWNPEKDALLRKLYDDGVSVIVIAKRLGVSHGSVTGRVYRLRMFRASGNLRTGRPPKDAPPKAPRPLNQTFRLKKPKAKGKAKGPPHERTAPVNPEPKRVLSAEAIRQLIMQANKMPLVRFVSKRPCLFTAGHRGAWEFCDQLAMEGSNFCEEHRMKCKIKSKPKYA